MLTQTTTHADTQTDWTDAFRAHLRSKGKSERTIAAYLADLRHFAAWFAIRNAQPLALELITSFDLQDYRRDCLSIERVKPATWNRRRAALSAFIEWCQARGDLTYNPLADVRSADEEQLSPRWLTRPDYGKFMRVVERGLNAARTDAARFQSARDAALIALMVWAGLRESEVCALVLADLDLGERSGWARIRLGKGMKYRQVPLNLETRKALAAWLDRRGDQPGPLFFGRRGEPLQPRAVQRRIAELGSQAGVSVTPHILRHTCAKRLADAGTPIQVIARILGHQRLETTRRYVEPGRDDLLNAVEKI